METNAKEQRLWKGRRVLAYDGSTVPMPDTPENQKAYPQPPQQKPGVGFPLARMAAFFSLSCGAVVELGICRNSGKGNSELGMLRKLWNSDHFEHSTIFVFRRTFQLRSPSCRQQ